MPCFYQFGGFACNFIAQIIPKDKPYCPTLFSKSCWHQTQVFFSMSNFHGEIWHKQNRPQDYHRQNQIISPQNTEFSQCFSSIWSRLRLRSPWLSQAVSTRWSIGWVMEVGTRSQWKIGCLGSVGEVTNNSQNNIRIHTYIITYIYIVICTIIYRYIYIIWIIN